MRRLLSALRHRLSLRLFGESRRTFAPLPPLPPDIAVSADRAMRVLELRPELRDLFPFALCPPDRGRLLDWWRRETPNGVSASDCLALLHEMDARPDRGLARMYRLQPSWQAAVPGALSSQVPLSPGGVMSSLVPLSPGGEGNKTKTRSPRAEGARRTGTPSNPTSSPATGCRRGG